jgi:DNA-binding transcriptional MerR regulator
LLTPTRLGANGNRYYDESALARLQRILLMRRLGLGLAAIAEVIDGNRDDRQALRVHVGQLRLEQERIERQIHSVERTITALTEGSTIMAHEMFDGFDHTEFKQEVEARWSPTAYAEGDTWWRAKSSADKAEWQRRQEQLAHGWTELATSGADPAGAEAQSLAKRHAEWLASIPGTPGAGTGRPLKSYLIGLGEMYVADERFAVNYGGTAGAAFVRDALGIYADRNL